MYYVSWTIKEGEYVPEITQDANIPHTVFAETKALAIANGIADQKAKKSVQIAKINSKLDDIKWLRDQLHYRDEYIELIKKL
jgi:hypothetical protein